MNTKVVWQKLNIWSPWIIFFFFIFVFPRFQGQIMPPVKAWIDSLGNFAPVGYMVIGYISTVIAPIGLGPINTVLQKSFGFWPSVLYYTTYVFLGLITSFWISRKFGSGLLYRFFPQLKASESKELTIKNLQNPFVGVSFIFGRFAKVMEDGSWKAFVVYIGAGNEILAYLHGTTKGKFWKFVQILLVTLPFNSFLFVTRNLAAGDNNWLYSGLFAFEFLLAYVPIIILFWQDIKTVFTRYQLESQTYNPAYKNLQSDFQRGDLTKEEYKTQSNQMSNEFMAKVLGMSEK